MTKGEIIEQLKSIIGAYEILMGHGVNSDILGADDIEAIREAIKALEQEPCDDCVSRQAVLEVIRKCHCEEWVKADICAPIEALSTVTPAEKVWHSEHVGKAIKPRKIGRWIDVGDEDEWFGSVYKCSVCGHETLDHEGFCSKCGSRMEVEKNGKT